MRARVGGTGTGASALLCSGRLRGGLVLREGVARRPAVGRACRLRRGCRREQEEEREGQRRTRCALRLDVSFFHLLFPVSRLTEGSCAFTCGSLLRRLSGRAGGRRVRAGVLRLVRRRYRVGRGRGGLLLRLRGRRGGG